MAPHLHLRNSTQLQMLLDEVVKAVPVAHDSGRPDVRHPPVAAFGVWDPGGCGAEAKVHGLSHCGRVLLGDDNQPAFATVEGTGTVVEQSRGTASQITGWATPTHANVRGLQGQSRMGYRGIQPVSIAMSVGFMGRDRWEEGGWRRCVPPSGPKPVCARRK